MPVFPSVTVSALTIGTVKSTGRAATATSTEFNGDIGHSRILAFQAGTGTTAGIGSGLTAYTFLNGPNGTVVPASLTEFAEPISFSERLKVNLGLYAQDQWTLKRLTLNYGIRYDYFNAFVPAQDLTAGPFVPARHYDQVNCVPCWKDISPRMAASYDLFGNGRTAVKVNVGRFVQADIYTMVRANNTVTRAILSINRTWTDSNGNFTPDCDL